MTVDDIKKALNSYGYTATDGDDAFIEFHISKTVQHVLNFINHTKLPTELKYVVIDIICGEVLKAKKAAGTLGIEFESAVKSISEGDTSVSFGTGDSSEVQFDKMVNHLINGHTNELLSFRRLRW